MKSNELMIGNWVYMFGLKAKVKTIDKNIEELGIEPIQLTEEILLKIEGVEKHKTIKDRYVLKDEPYTFEIEDGYWDEPSLDIMKNGVYIICVEHLHELQNTMFWLLKEELKIEL